MKKKFKRIVIIAVITLVSFFVLRAVIIYFGFMYPGKDYYGDEYIQIIYPTSISDYITSQGVIDKAEKAFSTITDYDGAHKKFGILGTYCVTHDDVVKESHKLHLISANLKKDKGYIWIVYSNEGYDKNDKMLCGSRGILTKWELEKEENEWTVISIREHP